MTTKIDLRFFFLFAALTLSGLAVLVAQPAFNPKQLDQSLAKITVLEGSPDQPRATAVATGFVWKEKKYVVTSLHVMRKGARYQVNWPKNPGSPWTAKPVGHLQEADLVLLEIEPNRRGELPGWTPLQKVAQVIDPYGKEVHTLGYHGRIPAPLDMTLRMGNNRKLNATIDPKQAEIIKKVKTPKVDLEVLYFQNGSLLPGFSGAPLVDDSGKLIGVGDGGLEEGMKNISWGIPAHHLEGLLEARGTGLPAELGAASGLHFASELEDESAPAEAEMRVIEHAGMRLVLKKTRTFGQMLETADNRQDLEHQLKDFQKVDVSSLRYDVYEDLEYGVLLAVPAGRDLTTNQNGLTAMFRDYVIGYQTGKGNPQFVRELLASKDIFTDVNTIVRQSLLAGVGQVAPDESSSSCSRSRDGGLLATMAYYVGDPKAGQLNGYTYVKVAAKGHLYLMVVSLLSDFNQPTLAQLEENKCTEQPVDCANPSSPCSKLCDWLHATTSVHLTSFANFETSGEGCRLPDQQDLSRAAGAGRTVHTVLDWGSFPANTMRLAQQGLYLGDLEVFWENGQWFEGGLHRPLPVQTVWRAGLQEQAFAAEVERLAQQGLQLKDLEVSFDGANWWYAGVFQYDFRPTKWQSYQNWQQLQTDSQSLQQSNWNLIDLEVPWGGGRFWGVGVYQFNAKPSTFRVNDWTNFQAQTKTLAQQGWNLTDIETYWEGQIQYFAGVYTQGASPALYGFKDWASFEAQVQQFKAQGLYLDDLEVFWWNGVRQGLGIFR